MQPTHNRLSLGSSPSGPTNLRDSVLSDKEIIKRLENNQVWYSEALEVLSPLRFYLNEFMEAERYSESGVTHFSMVETKVEQAKQALQAADEYFTKAKR